MLRFAFLLALAATGCREQGAKAPAPTLEVTSQDAGFPNLERPWGPEDYRKAEAHIRFLIEAGRSDEMPRFEASGASGATFTRMTTLGNLAPLANQELSLSARMRLGADWTTAAKALMLVYWEQRDGLSMSAELVELQAHLLDLSHAMALVASEFMATLPADAPDRAARQKGYEQMQSGWVMMMEGVSRSFLEPHIYQPSDLARLALALRRSVPPLLARLPKEKGKTFRNQLRIATSATEDQALKEALRTLQAALPSAR